jgi:hypothetical protein
MLGLVTGTGAMSHCAAGVVADQSTFLEPEFEPKWPCSAWQICHKLLMHIALARGSSFPLVACAS